MSVEDIANQSSVVFETPTQYTALLKSHNYRSKSLAEKSAREIRDI